MAGKHKELIHISQDELTILEGESIPKCKYCGKSIWYDNTKISYRQDGKLSSEFGGTTYRTIKKLNNISYPIICCQKCLEKEYPDFSEKNKSKIFNTFNKYVEYVFEIPHEEIINKNKLSVPTLENCIRKHGKEKGIEVYEEYKRKQAYSNSFEYKHKKYGWTECEYNKFNLSRSVTYDNLVKKHGEDEGLKIWNNYLKRQSYTSTNEYLIDKFGEENTKTILLLKSGKIDGFIRKYGEDLGSIKFNEYIESITDKTENTNKYHQSKRGLSFFNKIISELSKCNLNYTYYYGDNEYRKYSKRDGVLYSLDFYIPELNIDIEFNGDYWHANPDIYDKDWVHPIKKIKAIDIWNYDNNRLKTLSEEFGIDVINVWEKSIYLDKREKEIISKIVDKIKYVSTNKKNK